MFLALELPRTRHTKHRCGLKAGRQTTETISTGVTTTKHYTDSSSAPSYSVTTGGTNPGITKYLPGLSGVLPIITGPDGKQNLQIQDIHGDTVSTVTVGNTATPYLNSWSQYDEYGNQQTVATTQDAGITYGWAGQAEKATTLSGLILMGARVYNSITGRFTSRDPVPGGNENAYSYPNDPINKCDWTGSNEVFNILAGLAAFGVTAAICGATAVIGCLVGGIIVGAVEGAMEAGVEHGGEKNQGQAMLEGALWGGAAGMMSGGTGDLWLEPLGMQVGRRVLKLQLSRKLGRGLLKTANELTDYASDLASGKLVGWAKDSIDNQATRNTPKASKPRVRH